jgi:hypothetical protein
MWAHAISPVSEIVVGQNVTFSWRNSSKFNQKRAILHTSAGNVTIDVDGQEEYTWANFPFGSGWWWVELQYKKGSGDGYQKFGETTKKNFYHFNNKSGYQYSNFADFDYKKGPRGKNTKYGVISTTLYYEVMRDYSVDLNEYFKDADKLPGALPEYGAFDRPLGWQKTDQQIAALREHIKNLPNAKWDFIELQAGILTVKKGYRWDGASTVWNDWNIADNRPFYLRGSCMHDSLYDLMRMGYLAHDTINNDDYSDDGFKNRLMADCLMHMIFVEDMVDEDSTLANEFRIVRWGGAEKTQEDGMNLGGKLLLAPWKYHASELTAWASDGEVELRFMPADDQLKDPNDYGNQSKSYNVYRCTRHSSAWQWLDTIQEPDNPSDVAYTDTDPAVTSGQIYYYRIKSASDEDNLNWQDRHYDESNIEAVATPEGSGNALVLDGVDDVVEANLLSNDLSGDAITFEAWVYPEIQDYGTSILAFNSAIGDYLNHLVYMPIIGSKCGKGFFSYYDDILYNYVDSADDFLPEKWYHVAVTINESDEGVLYVNGNQQATFNTLSRPTRIAEFSIGRQDINYEHFRSFKGQIDEVRIWDAALAQDDIRAGMCAPMRGDEPGLVGLWHFDEPYDSKKAYDATFNGNDGMLSGYDASETAFVSSDAMNMTIFSNFTADITNGKAPQTVTFTDTSTGDITDWLWDFGDGNTSTEQNPQHLYLASGSYDVSLTVSGSDASNTLVKTAFITITDPGSGNSPSGGGGGGGGCFIGTLK